MDEMRERARKFWEAKMPILEADLAEFAREELRSAARDLRATDLSLDGKVTVESVADWLERRAK